MSYTDYLNTKHWKETRTGFFSKKHNQLCKICGEIKNLNAHHKRYKSLTGNNILFKENGAQLMALCKTCHNRFHAEYGKKHLGRKLLSRLQKEWAL